MTDFSTSSKTRIKSSRTIFLPRANTQMRPFRTGSSHFRFLPDTWSSIFYTPSARTLTRRKRVTVESQLDAPNWQRALAAWPTAGADSALRCLRRRRRLGDSWPCLSPVKTFIKVSDLSKEAIADPQARREKRDEAVRTLKALVF